MLWEKEVDAEVLRGEAWEAIAKRGFDDQRIFAAYLHTLRWNCVTSTDPHLFQSPFRAGIRPDAYQLEPLRKALLLPRVNLFIADDVGLGKTIEAGLIARELLLRKKVREIVVSCPPSMLLQWQDELETRFGLVFEIIDKDYMKRVSQERGFGVNPWSTHSRFLVSQRLLIDETYAGPLRDWLGTFRSGTLLILDEAHLHLEHRVVQRLLGRFRAQGFVYHDLSRACLAQTMDAIPRVILLGRLCLYGPGAARLHEELIPITARWSDPRIRKGALTPYAREAETKTLALLEEALLQKSYRPIGGEVLKNLQKRGTRGRARAVQPLASPRRRVHARRRKEAARSRRRRSQGHATDPGNAEGTYYADSIEVPEGAARCPVPGA